MSSPAATNEALLLIGHGTRDAEGVAEFGQLVAQLRAARPRLVVQSAFLELAPPTIAQALADLAARGVRSAIAMPLLLFAAGHAKRDIPQELAAAAGQWNDLAIRQTDVLGCHERILELSAERFHQALAGAAPVSAADTLLLMVGRGSHDPQANAEMARLARLRFEQTPVGWLEVCFTAMASPGVEQALRRAARLGFARVVVQPHLLFRGELLARIARQVDQARADHPQIEWLIADQLGPDPLLASAVLEIAGLP